MDTNENRITLRVPKEAAAALGVSDEFFDTYVRPEVKVIRRGRLVLVSVRELERWAETSSARTLSADAA
jgi:hypothetical protein